MPVQHIRREFKRHNSLYAPTYIALDKELGSGNLLHKPLQNPRSDHTQSKGKGVQREDADFVLELAFIRQRRTRSDEVFAQQLLKDDDVVPEEASGIECGCCFTENPFVRSSHFGIITSVHSSD